MAYVTLREQTLKGHKGLHRKFGDDAEWFEYADGPFFIIVGEKASITRQPALSVRIEEKPEFRGDGLSLKSPVEQGFAFESLWDAYSKACALWGFAPRSKDRARRFFDQTRGYGVLWAFEKS